MQSTTPAVFTNDDLLRASQAADAFGETPAGQLGAVTQRLRASPEAVSEPSGVLGWLQKPGNQDMLVQLLGGAGNTILSQGNATQQAMGGAGAFAGGAAQARTYARQDAASRLVKAGLDPNSDMQVTFGPGGATIKGVSDPEQLANLFRDGAGGPRSAR